jgi:hypothetical protein
MPIVPNSHDHSTNPQCPSYNENHYVLECARSRPFCSFHCPFRNFGSPGRAHVNLSQASHHAQWLVLGKLHNRVCSLRASPPVLSMWLQTVKFIVKNSKCVGLAQEIGYSAPNSCSLPWLVKGATQLCTSKTGCNELDLTATQFFWLVDHTDWSRWFAISSSHEYAVPVRWVAKRKTAKLRHSILLSRVTYWASVEMVLCRCAGYWSATGGRQLL